MKQTTEWGNVLVLNSLGNLAILYKVNNTCADNTGEDSHLVFSWVKNKFFVVLYSGVTILCKHFSLSHTTHIHIVTFKVLDTWV